MQVICPNCGARYAVDPGAIGAAGRTVQCIRCSHRWLEKPEARPETPAETATPARTEPDIAIRPQMPGADQPVLDRPAATGRHRGRWLAAATILIVVLGTAAYAWRDPIRDQLPAEWRVLLTMDTIRTLFAAPTTAARPGRQEQARLEIDLAASKVELADGRYVVQGEVVNTGGAPGSTSLLRLVFRKDDAVLGERAYPLVEGPIAPGGRVGFRQALDDPPPGTTDIVPAVE
ncbi:MAG: zinc-ribbon domain-containing protein [Reyranella sp.]|nr:zinc-ribbon domain-containing protein [Reyranella sp.]